jgi:hypothetical protein
MLLASSLQTDQIQDFGVLYGFALRSAGQQHEALSIMNDAYVRAGKPEELREVFGDVQSASQGPAGRRWPSERATSSGKEFMSGMHTTRLAASKAHWRFVKESRQDVRKTGWQVPHGGISPTLVGATPLPFPVSPTFEAAFGYGGNLRFLHFGYTANSRQFGHSDGGDDLPYGLALVNLFILLARHT